MLWSERIRYFFGLGLIDGFLEFASFARLRVLLEAPLDMKFLLTDSENKI